MAGPQMLALTPDMLREVMAASQPVGPTEVQDPVDLDEAAELFSTVYEEYQGLVGEACALRKRLDAKEQELSKAKDLVVRSMLFATRGKVTEEIDHDCHRHEREKTASAVADALAEAPEPEFGMGTYL